MGLPAQTLLLWLAQMLITRPTKLICPVIQGGGLIMHADLNVARNIGQRRAPFIGSVFRSKASVPAKLVRQFSERRVLGTRSGGRGFTADLRLANSHFDGEALNAARISKTQPLPDLVAADSSR